MVQEHEFYCWAPSNADGTPRTEWYIVDVVDPPVVDSESGELVLHPIAGPVDLDVALTFASWCNSTSE